MEVAWHARYATGIHIIDEQHQELFMLVETLRRAVQEQVPRGDVEALLDRLIQASGHHFHTEEGFMSKCAYPDLAQHVAEHAAMLTSLQELKARFQESQQAMALMIPTFMEGWLRHHISDGDFGFVTFLKARNLV